MSYQPLNEATLPAYLRSRPSVAGRFRAGADFSVTEVGDGNLNLVFIVRDRDQPGTAVVVKQALPYLRVAGESWPLTRERMRFETQALRLYNALCPGLAPEVFDDDQDMSAVVMEHLSPHEVMRKSLVARKRFPRFVEHVTTFLATVLFRTSGFCLAGPAKKQMQARFMNPEMNRLQEVFVYTHPYMSSPENKCNPLIAEEVRAVRADSALKIEIAEMKDAYMTHAEALIHADLHTGSIMLTEDDTRVIDPEFCYFGPISYDVGALLQNLVLNYLSHFGHTPDREAREQYQQYLLSTVRDIWNGFARTFDALWRDNPTGDLMPAAYWDYPGGAEAFSRMRASTLRRILQEAAGHGGVKFLRRMMGIVNVWDIESMQDLAARTAAERAAIRIGSRWLLERRRIESVDDMTRIVEEEASSIAT